MLRVIRKRLHHQTNVAKQRMWQAYQRGKKSKLNPDEWQPELLWNLPLTDVQAMFCLD
ncbi:MAG: hypothetical protein AAFW70_23570 [Cyanobacteria bacterium J06635_10]